MYGWTGKIAHIDLSHQKVTVVNYPETFLDQYVGGKGLGGALLRECATLPWDHPDMKICILTGPLSGTLAPTSGRTHILSISPQTGLLADASVGGKLATRLKRAGWDGLVITGKSDKPVGIDIRNDTIEFADAKHLWGKNTEQVHQILSPAKASLVTIGPAAENGVRFASIMVDRHFSAGRCGLGTCLAQKKVKYLQISGTGKTQVKHPEKLKKYREDIFRLTAASPVLMGQFGFTCLGTGAVYDLMDNRRMMPTDNFAKTRFENASKLNAAAYTKAYAPKKAGCLGCHILCKKIARTGKETIAMPEFETMSHFTALIGCSDTDLVVRANQICNLYGMDTISAASTLACHREITGINYTKEKVLCLLEEMATGTGLGKQLSLGAWEYAKQAGKPGAAMAVKKLELPAYDPRGALGMALGYAMSTRGGCHLRAYPIAHEIFRKPVATDRFSFSGKARIIKISEDLNAVVDSLIACKFTFFAATLEEYAGVYTAVTGIETSAHDLLCKGEAIYYNERIINAVRGADARDDDLPERFFTQEGASDSGILIKPIDRDKFIEAKLKYYRIRGLDENGMPTREKAESLGIEWTDW